MTSTAERQAIKAFTSAKRRGATAFTVDDETFHVVPMSMREAENFAKSQGQMTAPTLPDGSPDVEGQVDRLLAQIESAIQPDEWDRFVAYVPENMDFGDFQELVRWIIEQATGRHPTSRAS